MPIDASELIAAIREIAQAHTLVAMTVQDQTSSDIERRISIAFTELADAIYKKSKESTSAGF